MALKTKFFTFKESQLNDVWMPIGCTIHSARVYLDIDQTVLVELFCSYEERPENIDQTVLVELFCSYEERAENIVSYLPLVPAVDGTYIAYEATYICPLVLPDGRIGGLFQIV